MSGKLFGVLVALVALMFSVSGCGSMTSVPVEYQGLSTSLEYSGRRTVAVAVQDARDGVVSGERTRFEVGETPFAGAREAAIVTRSGRPLAEITAGAIAAALFDKGFEPVPVEVAPSDTRSEAEEKIAAAEADYAFLLVVNSWWTAIHDVCVHEWDLVLTVFDSDGNIVTEHADSGEDRAEVVESVSAADLAAEKATLYGEKIRALLNAPEVPKLMVRFVTETSEEEEVEPLLPSGPFTDEGTDAP